MEKLYTKLNKQFKKNTFFHPPSHCSQATRARSETSWAGTEITTWRRKDVKLELGDQYFIPGKPSVPFL